MLTDGVRTIDLLPAQGLNHHGGMLLVYLPKEKILPGTGQQFSQIAGRGTN